MHTFGAQWRPDWPGIAKILNKQTSGRPGSVGTGATGRNTNKTEKKEEASWQR
jgi:hypothetical protein